MQAETETYSPTAILLTGGAGFIGSLVAIRIVQQHPLIKVVVYDSLEYCASLRNVDAVRDAPNFAFVKGDIRSADLVRHVLKTHEIDTIMHFAAQTHVDNSFGNLIDFTMTNTVGTHVLLECARKYGQIKRFINVSTDEVYGETSMGMTEGLAERSVLDPTNPYSAAKAGVEMMCRAYMTSYKLPIIVTRGNNVYGPRQFPEKMIPKFAILASKALQLPIHGDGMSMRSYLHVHDVADAFKLIMFKGVVGEIYNIGTQQERSVLSVAQDIAAHFGAADSKSALVHVKDRAFNDRRYFICDKKLFQMGWSESIDWIQGLKETIEWYMGEGGQPEYWENGDVHSALVAHPRMLDKAVCRTAVAAAAAAAVDGVELPTPRQACER